MADIYVHLGSDEKAARLREKAEALRRRFDEAFWDEDSGFYAYCLDGDKRKILSVASNPGHLLWSGIVPKEKAGKVVERLLRPDMWSGWGIRTLSADHPAFNPHSYQNGSVWPHDNGVIAIGFKRYGFHAEAARVARDISEACSYFRLHQMPELYAGLQRNGASFPVQYLGANVPQAWAAGSVFALLQSIIGFQPRGDEGLLYLDPWLPPWLPDLTLRDLRVGAQIFDLQIHGKGAQVEIDVFKGDASRVRRRSFVAASEMLGAARVRG
jgi:glycogen debranching enzyme